MQLERFYKSTSNKDASNQFFRVLDILKSDHHGESVCLWIKQSKKRYQHFDMNDPSLFLYDDPYHRPCKESKRTYHDQSPTVKLTVSDKLGSIVRKLVKSLLVSVFRIFIYDNNN